MRSLKVAALLCPLFGLIGCTALIGDRQTSADLSASPDLAHPDLASTDQATLAGLDLAGADLTGVLGLPSQANSSIIISPTSVVADGSSNAIITVLVKDSMGNAVVGQPASLSSTGSGHVITPTSGITNGLGAFNATITSTKAETKTVTATVFGFTLDGMVTFTAGNANQGSSTLDVTKSTITADGVDSTTLTVTVKDANGNPVVGTTVSFSVNGSANTLTPADTVTDANGQLTATLTTTKAEGKTVTVTVGAFMLMQAVTAVPGNVDAAHSTLSASPTTGVVANGSAKSTITATLKDAFDNLISGVTVTFAATGGGTSFSTNGVASNGSGVATTTISSTTSGSKGITATANSVLITQSPSVTFDACPTAANTLPSGTLRSGTTVGGTNVYHPVCAMPTDSTELVYTLAPSTQSVVIDRGPTSFAGAVTDLRPSSSGCSLDSQSLVCSSDRYIYCPSLNGSYDVVIDGANASGSFDLKATLGAAKNANSYGVVQTAASFVSISAIAGSPIIADSVLEDGTAAVVLPFAFKFFGVQHAAGDALVVYQSGYIGFGSTTTNTHVNTTLPTATLPAETIAPMWAWWNGRNGSRGRVYALTQGSVGTRTYTVEWNQMEASQNASFYECINTSFQVVLHEATGQIEFNYSPVAEDLCAGDTPDQNYAVAGHGTIGLQGATTGTTIELVTANTATGLGPAIVGTCGPRGTTTPCSADKGYLFVPKSAGCP